MGAGTNEGCYGDVFWNPTASKYVAVFSYGTNLVADIKQYNLTIAGIT